VRQIGEHVLVVHLQEQLAGLDLVAYVDVDVLDLARGLRIDLEVVRRLDFAIGGEGLYQILIGNFGRRDADAFTAKRAQRVDRENYDDEG
jgi:hypothetical protein